MLNSTSSLVIALVFAVVFGILLGVIPLALVRYFELRATSFSFLATLKWKFTSSIQNTISLFRGDRRNLYKPINSSDREIRLLRLFPRGQWAMVEAELVYARLDDENLRYEALSYTWGGTLRLHKIILDRKTCLVTKNLAAALRHLQLEGVDRVIWIDALCIDQSNRTERSEQVRLMRDIYSKAVGGVVIWLGDNLSDTDPARGFLEQAERHDNPKMWLRTTIGDDRYLEAWYSVGKLLDNDYWKRVWIIQEVACASSITVVCGGHFLNWEVLVAVDSVWVNGRLMKSDLSEWYTSKDKKIPLNRNVLATLGILVELLHFEPLEKAPEGFSKAAIGPKFLDLTRASLRNSQKRLSLFDLMCIHHGSKATDPRDKVYALVGIAADCDTSQFTIDYSLPEFSAAQHTSEHLLYISKTLNLICFGLPCLPRWTVFPWTTSYRISEQEINTAYFLRSMGTGLSSQTGNLLPKYTAAGTSLADARLVKRRHLHYSLLGQAEFVYRHIPSVCDVLHVKGCYVDTIAAFMSDLTEHPRPFDPWLSCLRKIPIINRNETVQRVISMAVLLAAKAGASLFMLVAALSSLGYPRRIVTILAEPVSSGQSYIPLSKLGLPSTDAEFVAYPPGSSDWLGHPHLITRADDIKSTLLLVMKTSTVSPPSVSKEERIDSFWRTLIGNRTAEGATPPAEWGDVFNVILNGPTFVPADFVPVNRAMAETSDIHRAQAYVMPFFEALFASLQGRRVFITSNGRLGLATKAAKEGDMVCVFLGCSFPVVVRETGGNGKRVAQGTRAIKGILCGSAYLSGYMEGKAMSEMAEGRLQQNEFTLH